MKDNWESCIVHLINVREDELLDPRRGYWGHLVTLDGRGGICSTMATFMLVNESGSV